MPIFVHVPCGLSKKNAAAIPPMTIPAPTLFQNEAANLGSQTPTRTAAFDAPVHRGGWDARPALTCGQVRCLRNLKVLDAGQMLYDVLAVGIPRIDAVSEMGAIVYRHRSLPQSSSASRFTLGAAGFLNFSQSRERPET